MEYRRLGRTNLIVSVVGFGTNELRLVPERQAIETLVRGFELGVNLVHTSPDYEGAEDLVARAVAESGRRVFVASQGYDIHYNSDGPVAHFEALFEATCARLATERLDLYGIAAVDDREAFGENVWGKDGMVDFLLRKKEEGRLGSIYCTVHGEPAFIRKLIESDVFDAIMLSYNPLGFHLLTLHPPPERHFEDVTRHHSEVLPLCRERDIGVLAMMPLAGGLITQSRAFPFETSSDDGNGAVTAGDILRTILRDPDVASVIPGTASLDEAEENARAGHAPIVVASKSQQALAQRIVTLQASHCRRCGQCDSLCSQHLPVSWLFRAHDMATHRGESFETWKEVEYFRLHPELQATCLTCPDVTCLCPYDIDIPRRLPQAHDEMLSLLERGLVAPPENDRPLLGDKSFGAHVLVRDVPIEMRAGETRVCRIYLENAGVRGWFKDENSLMGGVVLAVFTDRKRIATVRARDDIHSGGRGHFVFELTAPTRRKEFQLRLSLLGQHLDYSEARGVPIHESVVAVTNNATGRGASLGSRLKRLMRPERATTPPETQSRTEQVEWLGHNLPEAWPADEPFYAYVSAANRGTRAWSAGSEPRTNLLVRVNGEPHVRLPLPYDVETGGDVVVGWALHLPDGSDEWKLSVSVENVTGAPALDRTIRRIAADPGPYASARTVARTANWSFYTPSQGVPRGRDGRAYPVLIQEAKGARIRDADGNEWVDWVMGWGSALLGYAHPVTRDAISRVIDSGAVLSLPHMLEMEVTKQLCDSIECAELVLFGKNGSDACTAAVRAARLHTGRHTVLFSGYHGWQEPFASEAEPTLARPDERPDAFRFGLNDFAGFCRVVGEHDGSIAAVMLEPAAQVEGVDGPVRDFDPQFLRDVARVCREQGAVLIFDEIMTGFRHPQGSVQRASGVVPDLAVFGKAVAAGMPLSALVGRAEILGPALERLFYHPTFKSEVYSFAAAAAALRLYRSEDVPSRVQLIGRALQDALNDISREIGVDGYAVGLPYRMVYRFNEPDERRRTLKRTLLQQELVKNGVLTFRGFMLPSLGHSDAVLDQTATAYRSALETVERVDAQNTFASLLEIPLVY